MDFSELPADIGTEAIQLHTKLYKCIEEDDWKLLKHHKKEGLTIFSKQSTEFNGRMFKGISKISSSPENCFQHFKTKEKWDSTIKLVEILEPIRLGSYPEAYIQRIAIHSSLMGLVAGRDFVDLVVNFSDEKAIGTMGVPGTELYSAQTFPSDRCPPVKEYVRGTNYYCCILAARVPSNPDQTELIYVTHTDLGGNLPVYLVEKAIPPAIYSFNQGLKSQLKQAGQLLMSKTDKFILPE